MADIHETALVADGAQIHESARIGPYCIVGPHAKIHENVSLHSFVVVEGDTEIHAGCELYPSVTVGMKPQILGVKDDVYRCIIGAGTVLREHVTVHGATPGTGLEIRMLCSAGSVAPCTRTSDANLCVTGSGIPTNSIASGP